MNARSIAIILVFFILTLIASQLYSQAYQLGSYGMIIGDRCGQVVGSTFSNDHLSIHAAFPAPKTLCGKLQGNTLTGTFDGQSFTMTFEVSGRGKGFLNDGTELLMLKGSQTDCHELAQTLELIGMLNKFHSRLQQEKVSYNEVIGTYMEKSANSIHLKLVLKTASVAQPGKRLIRISFGLENGEWGLVR